MKSIQLSTKNKCKNYGKYFAMVDDEDYEYLMQWNWQVHISNRAQYAKRLDGNKVIMMYREILKCNSTTLIVDHINHNGLDNRKENLRTATRSENAKNRKGSGKSKYLGVSWHWRIKRWFAGCHVNKKRIHLGSYKTEEEAALAYNEAAKIYHGEFANLNIIA